MDVADVFEDRCAVVTGAGSGIGRALAVRLAAAGARLVLVDASEAALLRTAEACELDGRSDGLLCRALDAADPDAWRCLAAEVLLRTGGTDLLVNDAGTNGADARRGGDAGVRAGERLFGRVTRAGFLATVHATEALLPQLAARASRTGFAVVANVSPPRALGAVAPRAPWRRAGLAARGLTEALRAEALAYHPGLAFSSVHPCAAPASGRGDGGPGPITTPDAVARLVLAGVAERRARILVPLPLAIPDGSGGLARESLEGRSRALV